MADSEYNESKEIDANVKWLRERMATFLNDPNVTSIRPLDGGATRIFYKDGSSQDFKESEGLTFLTYYSPDIKSVDLAGDYAYFNYKDGTRIKGLSPNSERNSNFFEDGTWAPYFLGAVLIAMTAGGALAGAGAAGAGGSAGAAGAGAGAGAAGAGAAGAGAAYGGGVALGSVAAGEAAATAAALGMSSAAVSGVGAAGITAAELSAMSAAEIAALDSAFMAGEIGAGAAGSGTAAVGATGAGTGTGLTASNVLQGASGASTLGSLAGGGTSEAGSAVTGAGSSAGSIGTSTALTASQMAQAGATTSEMASYGFSAEQIAAAQGAAKGMTAAEMVKLGIAALPVATAAVNALTGGSDDKTLTSTTTTSTLPSYTKPTAERLWNEFIDDFYGTTGKSVKQRTIDEAAYLKGVDDTFLGQSQAAMGPYQKQLTDVLGQFQNGTGLGKQVSFGFGGQQMASFVPKANRDTANQMLGFGKEGASVSANLANLQNELARKNTPEAAANSYSEKLGKLMQFANSGNGTTTQTGTVPGQSGWATFLQGLNSAANLYGAMNQYSKTS
jgi:hypothetical protein